MKFIFRILSDFNSLTLSLRFLLSEQRLANRHGTIHEIMDQKEFFANVKSTKHVICLFYTKTGKWTKPLQEHLTLIARKHLECKFIEIEAEYAPFLIEKLNIWMMPTLVLAKDNKVQTQLRGLDWVAPRHKTDLVECLFILVGLELGKLDWTGLDDLGN